jgi:hypothetical protein
MAIIYGFLIGLAFGVIGFIGMLAIEGNLGWAFRKYILRRKGEL